MNRSPIYASEFGNEVVARLASIDGSISNIFQDKPLSGRLVSVSFVVNAYHMFCSARIIYLMTAFNMCGSPLTAQVWSLMKYVLCKRLSSPLIVALDVVQQALNQLSLDQLVVCGFYAIGRLAGLRITFQHLLNIYSAYLEPYRAIASITKWSVVNRLWFNIDLNIPQIVGDVKVCDA